MPVANGACRSTRTYLKNGTAASHDRLDTRLGALVTGDARDYAAFLDIQYRARVGVEDWLAGSGTPPPCQSNLLAQDMSALGRAVPEDAPAFTPPAGSDALGVCWVLAGSSLGNRAILARLRKNKVDWPVDFLSDMGMTTYWRSLLPALERPHSVAMDEAALQAAQATFSHFNAIVADSLAREAA